MKRLLLLSSLLLTLSSAADDKFERDRAAILAMAGEFKVTFDFDETATLDPEYEIKKPYHAEARELVKVAEDNGKRITLQHLLIIDEGELTEVIKHWAQIWQYEDTLVLNFQADQTWMPENLDPDQVEGTWTQYVTQVDDSPRYRAAGT